MEPKYFYGDKTCVSHFNKRPKKTEPGTPAPATYLASFVTFINLVIRDLLAFMGKKLNRK